MQNRHVVHAGRAADTTSASHPVHTDETDRAVVVAQWAQAGRGRHDEEAGGLGLRLHDATSVSLDGRASSPPLISSASRDRTNGTAASSA